MIQALINTFKIADLRSKILFTLGMLAIYRIGFWIPIPGIDQQILADKMATQGTGSALQRSMSFVAIFTGGSLQNSTIFGLGIMPYISAAIIFQLLSSAYEPLKKKQNEGPSGRQQIMEWTRYLTVGLCILQGIGYLALFRSQHFVFPQWSNNPMWWIMAVTALTAGTIFLMWLGEQIDKYGIGNGVSLIITAGILTGMPQALQWVIAESPIRDLGITKLMLGSSGAAGEPTLSWLEVIFLAASFVFVVAGAVLMTVAQRRIPVQQAKHTRGRKVYGGQRSYLPLRVNHGGVMPIIFASSLMIFPSVIFATVEESTRAMGGTLHSIFQFLSDNLHAGQFPYVLCYVILVYFFSYFWTTVQFNPEEMSKQLRDHGSFIPGLRPGPRTAEYLEAVMERITYVGAGFLAIIAIVPMVASSAMGIPFSVAQFLGGTGLLIVVSVGLDFIQRIEANLLMRNYAGFLGGEDRGGRGSRIRGPRTV